ncbi:MAG: hypothetical protein R3D33_06120 [Hyphomicrobiaceae bacterium]
MKTTLLALGIAAISSLLAAGSASAEGSPFRPFRAAPGSATVMTTNGPTQGFVASGSGTTRGYASTLRSTYGRILR